MMLIFLNRVGGTLKCASRLADRLANAVDIHAIVSANADRQLLPKKIDLARVRTGHSSFANIICTVNPVNYMRIFSFIRNYAPDVIHFPVEHTWNILLQSRLEQYPVVQTIHDPVRHYGEEHMFYDFVRHMELMRADRFIVMSRKFQEAFVNFGVGPEYVDVIPHGSFEFSNNVWPGETFPITPLKKNILFAGGINHYKGINILLKAFALVLKKCPEATLTIAGKGNISEYRQLLADIRNVTVINRYVTEKELAQLHAACDFVVAPYIDASQSGVVSLALANGRTVIATRVGGLAEQVDDGETGLLVEPGNVEQLASAMLLLLGNTEKNSKMALEAKSQYSSRFSWESIAEKTLRTYTLACEEHKRRLKVNSSPSFFRNICRAIYNYRKEKRALKNSF